MAARLKGNTSSSTAGNNNFFPAGNPLEEEALAQAVQTDVDEVKVWVMKAEILRLSHCELVEQFVESGVLNRELFDPLVLRHGLLSKWKLLLKSMDNPLRRQSSLRKPFQKAGLEPPSTK